MSSLENKGYRIKAIAPGHQIAFILLSALPFWLGIYWLLPMMVRGGYTVWLALTVSLLLPLFLLFVAALIFGLNESDGGFQNLFKRWQLKKIKRSDLLWVLFLFTVSLSSFLLLGGLSSSLNSDLIGINPPSAFNQIFTASSFWGVSMPGNWWVLVLHLVILVINIFGEELWFRGIIFPKQQLLYKNHSWIAHGLSYYLFHMFYPWDILRLLPDSLAFGYAMQKTQNCWVPIIGHFMINSIGLTLTIPGIIE